MDEDAATQADLCLVGGPLINIAASPMWLSESCLIKNLTNSFVA